MVVARGSFEVSMTPADTKLAGATDDLSHFLLAKTYQGDLSGTARGQMFAHTTGVEGSAGYVAMEEVDGELSGRRGRFVLQHFGIMNRNDPSLRVTVVPDSATGELAGLAGELQIDVVDGVHRYVLEYDLPSL